MDGTTCTARWNPDKDKEPFFQIRGLRFAGTDDSIKPYIESVDQLDHPWRTVRKRLSERLQHLAYNVSCTVCETNPDACVCDDDGNKRVRWGFRNDVAFKEMIKVDTSSDPKKSDCIRVVNEIPPGTAIPFLGTIMPGTTEDDHDYNMKVQNFTDDTNQTIVCTPTEEKRVAYKNAFLGSKANEPSMDPINTILFICDSLPVFSDYWSSEKVVEKELNKANLRSYNLYKSSPTVHVEWLKGRYYHDTLFYNVCGWFSALPSMFEAPNSLFEGNHESFMFSGHGSLKNNSAYRVLYLVQLILWCRNEKIEKSGSSSGPSSVKVPPRDEVFNSVLDGLNDAINSWRTHTPVQEKAFLAANNNHLFVKALYTYIVHGGVLYNRRSVKRSRGGSAKPGKYEWVPDSTWPKPLGDRVLKSSKHVSRKVFKEEVVLKKLDREKEIDKGFYLVGEENVYVVLFSNDAEKGAAGFGDGDVQHILQWINDEMHPERKNSFEVANGSGKRRMRTTDILTRPAEDSTVVPRNMPPSLQSRFVGRFKIVAHPRKERVGRINSNTGVVEPDETLNELTVLDLGKHFFYGFMEEKARLWKENAFFINTCPEIETKQNGGPENYDACFKPSRGGPSSGQVPHHLVKIYIVTKCRLFPGEEIELDYGYGPWFSRKMMVFLKNHDECLKNGRHKYVWTSAGTTGHPVRPGVVGSSVEPEIIKHFGLETLLRSQWIVDPIKGWETKFLKPHSHTLETMPNSQEEHSFRNLFRQALEKLSGKQAIKYNDVFDKTVPEWIPPLSCLEEMDLDELADESKKKKKARGQPKPQKQQEKIKWRHYSEEEYDKLLWPTVKWD